MVPVDILLLKLETWVIDVSAKSMSDFVLLGNPGAFDCDVPPRGRPGS